MKRLKNLPQVVGLCGLPDLSFEPEEHYRSIYKYRFADQIKVMIGGSPTDEQVAKYVGADAYGRDANAAVNLSQVDGSSDK